MVDARLLPGVNVMIAVVEAGSFVQAADALGLTPSGVSRAIARLETRIGIRLFDRNPRAVVLTDEGRRFHDQVAPLLTGIEEAAEEASRCECDGSGPSQAQSRSVVRPHRSGTLPA
jgi:DNA-binding transcriptional LysR family regulator